MREILTVTSNDSRFDCMKQTLEARGYTVHRASSGASAIHFIGSHPVDVVLVEFVLCDMLSAQVCQTVREITGALLLVMTDDFSLAPRVSAFSSGANGLIGLPLEIEEFEARLNQAKPFSDGSSCVSDVAVGELHVDFDHRVATIAGTGVTLTSTEWRVLQCLARHQGTTVPTQAIIGAIWGVESYSDGMSLRVHISNLRAKIEPADESPRYILTEPRIGYRLAAE